MSSRVLFLLLMLPFSCSPTEESAERTVAALLPADTILFCEVEDFDAFRAAYRDSSIGRICAEEEVQKFLERPLADLSDFWSKAIGIPLEGLLENECRQMFVALIPVDGPGRDGNDFGLVVGWEGERLPACLALPTIHEAMVGGTALYSKSEDALARLEAGEQGSLEAKKSFQAARQALPGGDSALFIHVDVQNLLQALSDLDPLDFLEDVLERLPPLPVASLAARVAVRNGRTHTMVFLSDGPAFEQLRLLSPEAPYTADDLRLIPHDAMLAQFFNLSPSALADLIDELELFDLRGLSSQNQDLRADLLDRLGPRCLVMAPSEGLLNPTQLLASIEVRDADQVMDALAGLVPLIGEQYQIPVSLEPLEIEGSRAYRFELQDGALKTGALAVKGGWLTVSDDIEMLKQQLSRIDGKEGGLLGRADVLESWERLTSDGRPLSGFSYCALPGLYEWISGRRDTVRLALIEQFDADFPLDLALLPGHRAVTAHLSPSVAVSRRLEEGWLFEREGTLGGELTGLGSQFAEACAANWAASLTAPDGRIVKVLARGKQNATKTSVLVLKMAVQAYHMNNNRLPESLETLTQPDPNYFNECYIEDPSCLLDPWGRPYIYRPAEGRTFEILSYGADGVPGGEGGNTDISSQQPR